MGRLSRLCFAILVVLWSSFAAADGSPRFRPSAVWHQPITAAPLHPQSSSMINALAALGGFGWGRMQIDFSMHVVRAPQDAPMRTMVEHPSWGYYSPDCDPLDDPIPVPDWAAIEGQSGLSCDNHNEDCHLLVVQGDVLYEAYSVNENASSELETLCLAVWYLDGYYPAEGRGDHCTSADAAGFPIAPLLFNADDIAASLASDPSGDGDLGHAIRFILPNPRMASDEAPDSSRIPLYVRPASHAGGPSGPTTSVPYGARLRMRDDFPLDGYNPAARVILNTFKRYGIVLADGGNVALTAESELYTTASWSELGIDSRVFDQTSGAEPVAITDFEVIDTGDRIIETYDCVRTTVEVPFFWDGFESGDSAGWSQAVP
jgi:serine/threonine-protein kinase